MARYYEAVFVPRPTRLPPWEQMKSEELRRERPRENPAQVPHRYGYSPLQHHQRERESRKY